MSVLTMYYYYIHPESCSAWKQLEPMTDNPDGHVEEVSREEYENALIEFGITEEVISEGK